jgi:hypothetical protein
MGAVVRVQGRVRPSALGWVVPSLSSLFVFLECQMAYSRQPADERGQVLWAGH